MAKKKPDRTGARGRARDRGDTTTFTFEMTPELNGLLEECARRQERTKKGVLTLALKAYLRSEGLLPADEEGGKG